MTDGISRRTLLIGAGGALAGGTALALTPRIRDGDALRQPLDALVPNALGGWRGFSDAAIILPDAPVADRTYDATLSRRYSGAGLPDVMLVIAHGGAQSTSWSVHRPEGCYAAAGFAIRDDRDTGWTLADGGVVPGRFMTASRDERIEQVGYWRRVADGFPADREESLAVLRYRLAGRIPDGILVRMSIITDDAARARTAIAAFARQLIQGCGTDARRLLLGPLSAVPETAGGRR
ncbi:MAG: exosortase C-terminal domain/associated protein EpsI [Pseudomonadota bacterium]